MAIIKITLPHRCYSIYFRDGHGVLHYVNSGVPQTLWGATAEDRRARREINRRVAMTLANHLETLTRQNTTSGLTDRLSVALERIMPLRKPRIYHR